MISGKTQIAAAAAVLALSAASVSAAPTADVLEARGAGMSRVAKVGADVASDVAHRKTVGYVNDKIHEHYGTKPSVHPGLVDAARAHTKPHDSRIVAAATGHTSRRKRDLEDAIDELIARGAGMSRVAKVGADVASDVAHRKTVGYVNDKIHEHYGTKPSVHPGLVEAARQHTKPHDSRIVAAATGHTSRRKRDLEDELEDLMARGAGMSRIAKVGGDVAADMAHRGVVNAANDKIKEHLGIDKTHVHPGLAEAARIANKPHDPKLVAAVTGHGRSHKKRELEDALEELMARGAGMSRIAKVGGDIASDVAHRKTVGYVNDKIHEHYGVKPSVHPGLAEAARLATKPHDPKLVAAAIGHGRRKRELEDALEELMARGAGMSRIAKVGGDIASDVAHRKTVGYVNDKIHEHYGTKPSVHPGLAEAARLATKPHDSRLVAAATSHGRRKRSIEDELDELYAREFDEEFDELFARGAGMSRIAKVGGDVASDVAHRKTVGYVNDKIHEHYGTKPSVHPGLVEAARQHTKPHDSRIVAAATGRRKRDLATALMDYVEARSFELDELE